MATTLLTLGKEQFSDACADRIDRIALINGSGTVISNYITSFTFGTPSGGTVDLSSSVEFTVDTGATVAGVLFQREATPGTFFPMGNSTFTSTYSFPNGGVFELTSLEVAVTA